MYACDPQWWDVHIEAVRESFHGRLYTQWHNGEDREVAEARGLTAINGAHHKGLGLERLHFNGNSGAQAINLAYLLGATRIVLIGYDMGATGNTHFFGSHPEGLKNGTYGNYVECFNELAEDLDHEGVEVINCTRKTALHQFRRATIDDYPGFHRLQ